MAARENIVAFFAKPPPSGPLAADTFDYMDEPLTPLRDGEVRVEAIYFAIDAGSRGMVDDRGPYVIKLRPGDRVLSSGMVGRIVESRHSAWPVGWCVRTPLVARQLYAHIGADETPRLMRIDPTVAPLPAYLGVLGVAGFTAWVGLETIGRPKPGETVLVSAAGGAVGSAAGQLARIAGARAVGITGGAKKCAAVQDRFGFDACLDHKACDLPGQIARACPEGVDVYFENVGGQVQRAAFAAMRPFGRVVVCGQVAQYSGAGGDEPGPNLMTALIKRLRIEGFLGSDHYHRHAEFVASSMDWFQRGQLRNEARIVSGMENLHVAINDLIGGRNIGVQLHQVASDPFAQER